MADDMSKYLPMMANAVKFAEGNPRNHGVLSVKTDNPSQVVTNSVNNNYRRWSTGQQPAPWIKEKPAKYVDFMQRRWAPIGAENDPDNLNANWAKNVRWYLKNKLSAEEYNRLVSENFI